MTRGRGTASIIASPVLVGAVTTLIVLVSVFLAYNANQGLPFITVSGYAALGASKSDPRQRYDTNWQALDNYSWKLGKHSIKVGYEYRRTSITQFLGTNFRGKLNFASLADFLAGNVASGAQSLAERCSGGNSAMSAMISSAALRARRRIALVSSPTSARARSITASGDRIASSSTTILETRSTN